MSNILIGHVLQKIKEIPDNSVHCAVTSPPYWGLRDYGVEGQIGLEETPEEYIEKMVEVFREVKRVLRKDGTLFLNIGDSYAGGFKSGKTEIQASLKSTLQGGKRTQFEAGKVIVKQNHNLKPKDLVGIPWRLSFALRDELNFYLRSDIIWHKPNPMPESVTDRPTKSHEYIFLMAKSRKYYYDADAVREKAKRNWANSGGNIHGKGIHKINGTYKDIGDRTGKEERYGANKRTVWTVPTKPFSEAHFATFPEDLIRPCIRAGTSERGCCPKCGAPWERVVEKEGHATRPGRISKYKDTKLDANNETLRRRIINQYTTTGWRPTCDHNLPPISCTVLDPFFGAGTVGVVCVQEKRNYIGIEINPEYAKMAEKRIRKQSDKYSLLNYIEEEK